MEPDPIVLIHVLSAMSSSGRYEKFYCTDSDSNSDSDSDSDSDFQFYTSSVFFSSSSSFLVDLILLLSGRFIIHLTLITAPC